MITTLTGSSAKLPQGMAVGHASNLEAGTGCSVVLCPQGAIGSVAVFGGAPATRETDLLAPDKAAQSVNAVVLSGGSAFGLDAASGVANFLEEQNCGVSFGGAVVPIVVAASLFDLNIGSAEVRPDAKMGYEAAAAAQPIIGETGTVGAGTGASIGKFMGPDHAMKGGFGAASVQADDLLVSAVVALNSLGSIFDRSLGSYIAGAYVEQEGVQSIVEPLKVLPQVLAGASQGNTTLAVVMTNAQLDKSSVYRVASLAHDGLARAVYPVHTSFDGDAIFALAKGDVEASPDLVGTLGALAVEQAILDATTSAQPLFGLPSASSLCNSSSQAGNTK